MKEPRIDPKRTRLKVTELLDHVATQFCLEYCKWPEQYKDADGNEMDAVLYEEHCKNCPIRLI